MRVKQRSELDQANLGVGNGRTSLAALFWAFRSLKKKDGQPTKRGLIYHVNHIHSASQTLQHQR